MNLVYMNMKCRNCKMDLSIGNRKIGGNNPVFIIAELSANHNQKYNIAVETIKAAKNAGADAIKFQTYTPDTITLDCDNDFFKIKQGTIWDGKTLFKLYQEAYTPWEWQPKLKCIAEDLGLICFSSPFDKTAVDFLENINVPAYKVASFEITDIPLIKYIASKGKPIIISTGIATLADIEEAVNACREIGNAQIALLKCTSSYPAPIEEANLLTIPNMYETFGVEVGLSDHTMGSTVALASVVLGAKIIEKHFIMDRSLGGPDASFSMEPQEFITMVNSIRDVEKAMGTVCYNLSDQSKKNREFSRSLFIVKNIKAGELFTEDNVRSIRPGFGLHPRHLNEVYGKKSKMDLKKGTPLQFNMIKE